MPTRIKKLTGPLMILMALAGLTWAGLLLFQALNPSPAEPAGAIKIRVDEEGIYRIAAGDLSKLGWEAVDPAGLLLENAGEPYPFYTEGEGSELRILFFGGAPESPLDRYTGTNAYILYRDREPGKALQLELDSSSPIRAGEPPTGLPVELILEENALYVPKFLEGRPWMWEQLAAPGSKAISFELEALGPGPGELQIELIAATQSEAVDPDHHVTVSINGQVVADESWDGAGPHSMTAPVEAGLLRNGENEILLEAVGDTGVTADIVLLDRIVLQYSRFPTPSASPLLFTAQGSALQLAPERGWEGGYLFDLTRPALRLVGPDADSALPTTPGHDYLLASGKSLLTPLEIAPLAFAPDLRGMAGADYVAIGSPELLAPLEPLLALRREQGLLTAAIPAAAVFDQFGDGRKTPQAIRNFLRYAYENWENPPRYVLLLGDWSYDPLGYLDEPDPSWLPSFFVFTEFGGETVSDVKFTQLDADDLPDIALGRFPARDADQVRSLVEKTLNFEALGAEGWSRRVLAVADGTEPSFAGDAGRFLDGFSVDFTPRLLTPPAGSREGAVDIAREIDEGVLFFSYFGHGSITQLGVDRLFTAADAAGLSNGARTPIMINITCLAGLFTHPSVESLTEAMLWNPGGGAVAALSATSLTLPVYQEMLSKAFVEGLTAAPGSRLGDILLFAQRQIPLDVGAGALEVRDTFLLFGDPALVIPR